VVSAKPSYDERSHFRDTVEITVDVQVSEAVKKRYLGDEQVRDGNAMPQPMMVREVTLQFEGLVKDIGWASIMKRLARRFVCISS
jgi:hypothetical protein